MTPIQKAYGLLWREMRVSDKPYVREARKILLASMNHGEQSEAIAWARTQYPMTERELSGIGEPSVGAQIEGVATVNSEAREPASEIIYALESWSGMLRREKDINFSRPADCMDAASDAMRAALARIEQLESALEPFIALRDQSPSQMAKIIHKYIDGVTPVALTVTKDQFKAALSAVGGLGT